MNEKFESKKGEMQLIDNDDLDCKGCIYVHSDSTTDCVIYQNGKPGKILCGGKCEHKKMEQ